MGILHACVLRKGGRPSRVSCRPKGPSGAQGTPVMTVGLDAEGSRMSLALRAVAVPGGRLHVRYCQLPGTGDAGREADVRRSADLRSGKIDSIGGPIRGDQRVTSASNGATMTIVGVPGCRNHKEHSSETLKARLGPPQ